MFTHILFDFFGTLVEYSSSLTEQGYNRSHRLLTKAGALLDYEGFLKLWSLVFAEFDREAEKDHREFSMYDVAGSFLQRALGRMPSDDLVKGFVDTYIDEWNEGVHYHPGIRSFLERLSAGYRLGIITNAHHAPNIRGHLQQMEVEQFFAAVVTSVEQGRRKPHSAIFTETLHLLDASAERCVYVGDSYEADYLGARRAGMEALLIDVQANKHEVGRRRISHLFEIEERLFDRKE